MTENKLILNKHILVSKDINIIENFCGIVITDLDKLDSSLDYSDTLIYITGDINISTDYNINVIIELSTNYEDKKYNLVHIGEVPISIHNVGVLFRNFFNTDMNYFKSLCEEHNFQSLTESNKLGSSYRKGIYLSKVKQVEDEIHFNLLRCSTNLNGPTDNFRDTDHHIINKVNNISKYFFEQKVELNHVLAQVYENSKTGGINKNKEVKATIKQHSDKTKDMPKNALIAFCTFYKNYINQDFLSEELTNFSKSKTDIFNYCYKTTSVLTYLRFRLKRMVEDKNLTRQFDIILYPNSVFLISLNTNRLYTHEIIPSILPVATIPTRLGYVIRCSNTEAIYKDDTTYIVNNDKYIKLEEPHEDDITELRQKYYLENLTDQLVYYNDVHFSMNKGDYTKPIV